MKAGDTYTLTHVVAEKETAEVLGSGGLPVYSTPSMICLMELVSYRLAEQNGHQSVGTKVNISHLRACKVGTELTARAELTLVEGRRLVYKVSVSDAQGLIGEGEHERFTIDPERFMSKLQ
jgi:predicted thioesterase